VIPGGAAATRQPPRESRNPAAAGDGRAASYAELDADPCTAEDGDLPAVAIAAFPTEELKRRRL